MPLAERACETCGKVFRPRQKGRPNRFCSSACYGAAITGKQRVERAQGGRITTRRGHPLASPTGIVYVHRLVLYEKIGPGSHPCHWCGTAVTWQAGAGPTHGNLIADHLNWDRDDNRAENLVPSCTACNAHRTRQGDRRLIADDELFVTISRGGRTRAVERVCEGCGATFAAIPAQVKAGKGRFCSRSCARRMPRRH